MKLAEGRGDNLEPTARGALVVVLIADRDVRVLSTEGEILRELVLDPSRKYQPLG
jgi:hypothetical protein